MPTTTDVAIFDSNSGVGNSVISASITIQGLECDGNAIGTGTYAGTLTHNSGVTLTINTGAASSFRLTSGMTYTAAATSSLVTFTHTSGTASLKSASKAFAAITINGAGGTTTLVDALSVNAVGNSLLTVTSGTFDALTNVAAITANEISLIGSTLRTVSLGGTVTVGGFVTGGQSVFSSTGTNLTYTKNSANIIILPPTSQIVGFTISFGQSQNNVTFNNAASFPTMVNMGSTVAGITFTNLTINAGWSLNLVSGTLNVTNPFTWVGTQANPIILTPNIPQNATPTFSCPSGTCTLTWGSLGNVQAAGGATFIATNTFNGGNTSGWSITPPADSTSSGIAATVWKDTFAGGDFATSGSVGLLMSNMQNLNFTVPAIGRGTVTGSPSTTSIPTSAFTPATSASVANQLVGRVVLFDAATTTVALRGQVATISASSASATPTLTVSALTATPASGDTFSVI